MSTTLTTWTDEARDALEGIGDLARGILSPTIRLGVTGLSRAGKTVFITALVHNLLHQGRLPVFRALREGRISRVTLDPQPDDAVPRFQYEDHVKALADERIWPDSTRAISELRLTVRYESASAFNRMFGRGELAIDIVDYPGEWLLDLPLLNRSYDAFSTHAFEQARKANRAPLSEKFRALASLANPDDEADETQARHLSAAFTEYLKASMADASSLSTLPPGRFLMPGDLEGSPALTFAPLPGPFTGPSKRGSLRAMMERRYESYKAIVVKPFFRDHFSRLDRQILLVDTLQAIHRGPAALADLEEALADVLACFRAGQNLPLLSLFQRRIDKVLVAATKADHLHHESHHRLENITRRITASALEKIGASGAGIEVLALASVRATREATVERHGELLPVIMGTPMAGETIGGTRFDGQRTTAVFPGDLPDNPDALFDASGTFRPGEDVSIVRFRPPLLERSGQGLSLSLPHIRLDKALDYLLGDRLA